MGSSFEVIKVESDVVYGVSEICIEVPFEVICTVPKKPYGGTLIIEYTPSREEGMTTLLEWNSFAEWVQSLRSEMYLAEELASVMYEELTNALDPASLRVEVEVTSAFHLPVRVVAEK